MSPEEFMLYHLPLLCTSLTLLMIWLESKLKESYDVDDIRGEIETQRILTLSNNICKNQIRMFPETFNNLCDMLKSRDLLKDTNHITSEQQLVMFLHTLAHNIKNRVILHNFDHSGETVSRHFNQCLVAVLQLTPILMAPLPTTTPERISSDPTFASYFQDCIRAIDGTHIPAFVPVDMQKRFRDRKCNLSQNVLVACDFDQKFTYVLARWEGSAGDGRLLQDALSRANPILVPRGKYYLVDAGFANKIGFLSPYRNVRYHLKEWRRSNLEPQNAKELFNHRHSSLRNVIECSFGLLKARFKILKTALEYPMRTQVRIVNACCLLHNLLLNVERVTDEEIYELEENNEVEESIGDSSSNFVDDDDEEPDVSFNTFRDDLANQMWSDYCSRR